MRLKRSISKYLICVSSCYFKELRELVIFCGTLVELLYYNLEINLLILDLRELVSTSEHEEYQRLRSVNGAIVNNKLYLG